MIYPSSYLHLTVLPLTGSPEQECQLTATTFIYKNVSKNNLPKKATLFCEHNYLTTQTPH